MAFVTNAVAFSAWICNMHSFFLNVVLVVNSSIINRFTNLPYEIERQIGVQGCAEVRFCVFSCR